MEHLTAARRRSIAVVALAAIAVIGCGKEAPPPPRPAPQVGVLTIEPVTIPYVATFIAQTESSRQVNIVARVNEGIVCISQWCLFINSSPLS